MAEGIALNLSHSDQPRLIDGNGMVRASEVVYLEPTDLV
jgi:hypothetical protein